MTRASLAACLLCACACAGGALAADDPALRVVEACRARLDPRVDIGVERIQKRCPDLLPAIATAPWHALVPSTLRERREELSAESLRALAELIRHANAPAPPTRRVPDVAQLAPVLDALGAHGQEGATRWERFKRWLKDLRKGRKEGDEGWLTRWSRDLTTSEGVARIVSYVGYALLAALALFVVWGELRAAGLFDRRRAAARNSPEALWRRRLLLADVLSAPLAERPGMLLRLLGEALTRAHRLPAADGLTAAAIARRAELDAEADRAELARVATMSDEIRYAGRTPPADELERVVAAAQGLLAKFAKLGGRR